MVRHALGPGAARGRRVGPARQRDEQRSAVGLLDPLLDSAVSDGDRAGLVVNVFRAVLAARLVPLLDELPRDW